MTPVPLAIRQRVEAKIRETISRIEQKYNIVLPYPTVTYDIKGTGPDQ